jgi:tetratricopeptide (TPR) repeat protein
LAGVRWIIEKKRGLRVPLYLGVAILAIIMMVSASRQCKVWKNSYTLWNNVVKKYPALSYGYYFRGNTMFRSGNLKLALNDYNYAIKLENDHAEFYRNRGSTKDNMGDFEGAISDLSKAIELYPDYASAYMDRAGARAKARDKDLDGAINDIDKAIEIAPEYWEAFYRRGVLLRMKGDHAKAIDDFDKCIGKVSKNDRAYLYRGLSKNELGLLEEACEDWKMAESLGNSQAASMAKRYCD